MPTLREKVEARKKEDFDNSLIHAVMAIENTIKATKKNAENTLKKVPEYEKAMAELEKVTTLDQLTAWTNARYKLDASYAVKPKFGYTVEGGETEV